MTFPQRWYISQRHLYTLLEKVFVWRRKGLGVEVGFHSHFLGVWASKCIAINGVYNNLCYGFSSILRLGKKPATGALAKPTGGRNMLRQRKCKERQKRDGKRGWKGQKVGEIVKSSVACPLATLFTPSWLLSEWSTLLSYDRDEDE